MLWFLAQATQPFQVSPDTLVPVGCVLLVGVFVITGVTKIVRRLDRIEETQRTTSRRLDASWSRKDQEIFQLRLQLRNPTMKVPAIHQPGEEHDDAEGNPQ